MRIPSTSQMHIALAKMQPPKTHLQAALQSEYREQQSELMVVGWNDQNKYVIANEKDVNSGLRDAPKGADSANVPMDAIARHPTSDLDLVRRYYSLRTTDQQELSLTQYIATRGVDAAENERQDYREKSPVEMLAHREKQLGIIDQMLKNCEIHSEVLRKRTASLDAMAKRSATV